MNTFQKIHDAVARIPKGRVATYGQIAKMVGMKNPRVVGFALHVNRDSEKVPCHRVVNKDGYTSKSYAMGGRKEQSFKLKLEGVYVSDDGQVNLQKFIWKP